MRGKFISLEGGEHVGKSTHCDLLYGYLTDQLGDGSVELLREPGSTPLGEHLRKIIKGEEPVEGEPPLNFERGDLAIFYMLAAARAEVFENVVIPRLREGVHVLADRSIDTTIAYQGHGFGIDEDLIRVVTANATQGIRPNLTLLIDPPVGFHIRSDEITDAIEGLGQEFHGRVYEGFREIAQAESRLSDRIKIVPYVGDDISGMQKTMRGYVDSLMDIVHA